MLTQTKIFLFKSTHFLYLKSLCDMFLCHIFTAVVNFDISLCRDIAKWCQTYLCLDTPSGSRQMCWDVRFEFRKCSWSLWWSWINMLSVLSKIIHPTTVFLSAWTFLCFWYRSLKQIVYFWRKMLSVCLLLLNFFLGLFLSQSSLLYESLCLPLSFPGL